MADEREQVLDFIYWEAQRRPKFFLLNERVNVQAVAYAMGVHPTTILRLRKGRTQRVSARIYDGLKRLTGIESKAELLTAVERARPRPDDAYLDN